MNRQKKPNETKDNQRERNHTQKFESLLHRSRPKNAGGSRQGHCCLAEKGRQVKRILAIDPGMSGGIAYHGHGGIILDSMPATDQDVSTLILDRLGITDVCYIEKVGGYVGGKGAPGSAMFNFGRNVGFIHGLIASTKTRVIEVAPQRWQKTIQAGTKATHGTRWKAHLKQIAQQRHPRLSITLKTADALLILEHALIAEGVK